MWGCLGLFGMATLGIFACIGEGMAGVALSLWRPSRHNTQREVSHEEPPTEFHAAA